MKRSVKLFGPLTVASGIKVINELLRLNEVSNDPIHFFISSPGGNVNMMLAIASVMDRIKSPVHTVAVGRAASAGAYLLLSGEPGKRFAMEEARIMLHQHRGGTYVMGNDRSSNARLKGIIYGDIASRCGGPEKDASYWETILERDLWLDAETAKMEGVIDEVYYASEL